MELLNTLYQSTKLIVHLGFGAAFTAASFSSIYFVFCLAIPSLFSLELLPVVSIIGGLLGYSVQGILALTNRNKNRLNEAQIEDQILQNRIDSMWNNVDLRRISESEASEITTQAYRQLILSSQENETTNLLESQEQRQIPPSQEEE